MGQLLPTRMQHYQWNTYNEFSFNSKIALLLLMQRGNTIINSKYNDVDKIFLNLYQTVEKTITTQNVQIKQLNYYPEVYLCNDVEMDLLNNQT